MVFQGQDDRMSRANDIYNYKRQVERELENLQSDSNSDTIRKYHQHRVAEGISLARQHKCLNTLRQLSRILGKKFDDATKDDMVRLVAEIEQKNLSTLTKRDYKVILKLFYKWLFNSEDGYPPVVKWIRPARDGSSKLKRSDLLTSDEIKKLFEAALTLRDKSLIAVLAESGRRIGEILTIRIGDVEFDRLGARLLVDGKTGRDYVRIMSSAQNLATWLDNHPFRNDPNAPVWITESRQGFKQISYSAARCMLRECLMRAGMKKRVWFHLFRHTRGTQAAKLLTSSHLCALMGWRQGSKMPGVYIHLAGEDIDEAQAIMNNVTVVKEKESQLQPLVCSRCDFTNSPLSKFCNRCGFGLDLKSVIEIDRAKDRYEINTLNS